MNEEIIKDIFITVAFRAIERGKEIRLEKGKNKSESGVLGGNFSKNNTEYDSLSLHVYNEDNSGKEDEPDDEDED